ncbi:radical SAM protein [Heliobacterium undosum]|uniref:Radical SAM protein n=1 Tax=Heliomicrobium undosum TaxID=121734 RepID=A0A845L7G4_9FIRM|nr:radical SAM protein [Heliomicrobium undosum]MZP30590.1 radical SAM protein [Heliomicrobium undosum]
MKRPYILLLYVQRMIYKRTFEFLDNLGLMTLAAYLEERGYKARVFTGITTDAMACFQKEWRSARPDVVGFYCDYDNQSSVEAMSRHLRERFGVPVVVGGPQAIHLGREFLERSQCSFLVRGDGEEPLYEIMEWMRHGQGSLDTIRGVLYLDEAGKLVETGARPLLTDLDRLPFPRTAHLLGRDAKYNLSVLSARGCPFRCAFCYEGGNTKNLRMRRVETVVEEIRLGLEENPQVKYVWFVDDTFTVNADRTAHFCEALAALRQRWDFVWFCEGHAAVLARHPQLIPMMVEAGMARMQIGMESGWQPALEAYGKQATVDQIEEVVRRCYEASLPQLAGNFIIGGAHDSEVTLEMTAAYAEGLHRMAPGMLDLSTTFVIPLPNTAITNCPARFRLTLIDAESYTSLEDYPVTETAHLSVNEVSRWRYRFVQRNFDTMKELFASGQVPHGRIRQHFTLAHRYGVTSTWFKFAFNKDPLTNAYYSLLTTGKAKEWNDLSRGEREMAYPSRVFDLDEALQWFEGRPVLEGRMLTPLEYELLQLCGGTLCCCHIAGLLAERHPKGMIEGHSLRRLFEEFAQRHWIVFLPE